MQIIAPSSRAVLAVASNAAICVSSQLPLNWRPRCRRCARVTRRSPIGDLWTRSGETGLQTGL